MRRLYFLKVNGRIIWQSIIGVSSFSIEEEMKLSTTLADYKAEEIDVLEIGMDEYVQDFKESNGYRIDPATKQIQFSYPDPNEPSTEPVYIVPLSEQLEITNQAHADLLYELMKGGIL